VRNSILITAGYARGEGTSVDTETRDVVLFMLCTALLWAPAAYAAWRRRGGRWHFALAAGGLDFVLFMVFKGGYVRHDAHEITATATLAVLAFVALAPLWAPLRYRVWRGIAVTAASAALALTWYTGQRWNGTILPEQLARTVVDMSWHADTALRWLAGRSDIESQYNQALAMARKSRSVPPVHGTVDVYPWDQAVIFSRGLDYRPRPVIASYLAYSARLAELNAEFLRGPRAPDSVLFDIAPIDGRFPALEDGLSWPELLTRYDLKDATTSFLLLERAAEPRGYRLTPLSQLPARLGETVAVPACDDPVWAMIDVKLTTRGKLVEALYKPPVLTIAVRLESGDERWFRLIPSAGAGFLLSPLITDRVGFALLGGPDWARRLSGARVASFVVSAQAADGVGACYEPRYTVTMRRLEFARRDISRVPGMGRYLRGDR